MKYYCPCCGHRTEHDLEYMDKEFEFEGNKISILAKTLFCRECSSENHDDTFFEQNKKNARIAYEKLKPYID